MEYAFIIEFLPDMRSLLGVEMLTSETLIEVDGRYENRKVYAFTIGLGLIHIRFMVYRPM